MICGMRKIIERKQPTVFFESIFLTHQRAVAMMPTGYRLMYIDEVGDFRTKKGGERSGHNAVFLPPFVNGQVDYRAANSWR